MKRSFFCLQLSLELHLRTLSPEVLVELSTRIQQGRIMKDDNLDSPSGTISFLPAHSIYCDWMILSVI